MWFIPVSTNWVGFSKDYQSKTPAKCTKKELTRKPPKNSVTLHL